MTTFRRFNLDEIHEKINKNLKALQILDIGDERLQLKYEKR